MGNQNKFCPGDIVASVSGRDMKRYYVVMYAKGDRVGICDGKLHKTQKIKNKNPKHIKPTGCSCEPVKEKLISGKGITDSEIKRAISEFQENNEGSI